MQLHKKAAEERLSGSTGMSFLAKQRQAAGRRSLSSNTKQAQTTSPR